MAKLKQKQWWSNRIVKYGESPADSFLAHEMNARRHPGKQRDALRGSLNSLGWIAPVVVSAKTGKMLDGHARIEEALSRDEAMLVPYVEVEVSEDEERLILATLDPISALASYDKEALDALLHETSTGDAALQQLLSDLAEAQGLMPPVGSGEGLGEGAAGTATDRPRASLADRFIVPPFSVLDARQGYWQERKRAWLALGIKSELGRGDGVHQYSEAATIKRDGGRLGQDGSQVYKAKNNGLLGFSEQARSHYKNAAPGGSLRDAMTLGEDGKTRRGDGAGKPIKDPARCFGQDLMRGEHVVGQNSAARAYTSREWVQEKGIQGNCAEQSGTSIFDPVLCELAYRWFCPPAGAILDPFAGGSVRGIVAAKLDRAYAGLDLRAEQIEANRAQAKEITPANPPRWITGDSREIGTLAPGFYDLIFSCPPYADLEVYSDDPRDISTLSYGDFLKAYRQIIAASLAMLNADRFACFVVGDVRDRKGLYRNFVSDTIAAFHNAGARLYNEAILVTSVGSLPIRVGRQSESGRKLGKTHQNVLVFVKGDPKRATEACGKIDVFDPAEEFGEVV